MPEARGPQARGMRAYISGKSRVHMLQVICITSVRGQALSSSSLTHTLAELLYIRTCEGSIVGFELVSRNMCYKYYQKLVLRNRDK